MDCDEIREHLVAVAENCASDENRLCVEEHLDQCGKCRTEMQDIAQIRQRLKTAASAVPYFDLQSRVLGRISGKRPRFLWHRPLRWAGAGLAGVTLAVAGWTLLDQPSPAWAIEQSIEAMRGFRGLHLTGNFNGTQNLEFWIRIDSNASQMRDLKGKIGDITVWVKDHHTYFLPRGSSVVLVDDAPTVGIFPWPGPELLELARTVGFREVSQEFDLATDHPRIKIETSMTSARGLESSIFEFDKKTKMLVGITQWPNLDRAGRPSFQTTTMVYFEDLPDEDFALEVPPGLEYRPKEITVPEELLGMLANPQDGISAAGLSENEAARRVVAEMQDAVIHDDWVRFKRLVPTAAHWSDDMLKAICHGVDGRYKIVEVLEIGQASPRGQSRLGRLLVVPSRIKRPDGRIYEEKFTVLFRGPQESPSCVVFSPYGTPYPVE